MYTVGEQVRFIENPEPTALLDSDIIGTTGRVKKTNYQHDSGIPRLLIELDHPVGGDRGVKVLWTKETRVVHYSHVGNESNALNKSPEIEYIYKNDNICPKCKNILPDAIIYDRYCKHCDYVLRMEYSEASPLY